MHTLQTPWSVFQDGLKRFSTISLCHVLFLILHQSSTEVPNLTGATNRTRQKKYLESTSKEYLYTFLSTISHTCHSLFKVLFNFPSRYLYSIGIMRLFRLWRGLPPASDWTFKQSNSINEIATKPRHLMGFSPVTKSTFTTNQARLDKVAQSTSHCR